MRKVLKTINCLSINLSSGWERSFEPVSDVAELYCGQTLYNQLNSVLINIQILNQLIDPLQFENFSNHSISLTTVFKGNSILLLFVV